MKLRVGNEVKFIVIAIHRRVAVVVVVNVDCGGITNLVIVLALNSLRPVDLDVRHFVCDCTIGKIHGI